MPDAPPPTPRCRVALANRESTDDVDVLIDEQVDGRLSIGSVVGLWGNPHSYDATHYAKDQPYVDIAVDVTRDEAITLLHVHLLMNEPCYDGVLEREFPHLFATPLEHVDAVV